MADDQCELRSRRIEAAVDEGHKAGIAVVIGSTAAYQREAVRRARYAEKMGADGSMLAAPYALPVTPAWAMSFFTEVANSLDGDMALMVYNYSPLNGVNITAEMWEGLLDIENIKAIKESNFALPHFDQVLLTIADRIAVFSGNDPAFFHASMLGAVGATGIFAWAGLSSTRFTTSAAGNHNDPCRAFERCRRCRRPKPGCRWALRARVPQRDLELARRRLAARPTAILMR
jgi:hypothetical protein